MKAASLPGGVTDSLVPSDFLSGRHSAKDKTINTPPLPPPPSQGHRFSLSALQCPGGLSGSAALLLKAYLHSQAAPTAATRNLTPQGKRLTYAYEKCIETLTFGPESDQPHPFWEVTRPLNT